MEFVETQNSYPPDGKEKKKQNISATLHRQHHTVNDGIISFRCWKRKIERM
jgi:hypothetical protein